MMHLRDLARGAVLNPHAENGAAGTRSEASRLSQHRGDAEVEDGEHIRQCPKQAFFLPHAGTLKLSH